MTSLQAYTPYTYSPGFQSEQFHHVVLSISGTTHTLYLDGSAVNITKNNLNIFSNFTKIINPIFGAQSTLTQAFNGVIGDVRVYNYNISSTQVSNLYLNRNLVIHYPFDASVNNQTPNYASLVYDASFVGGATTSSSSLIGNNALSLTNTSGTTASQYVLSAPGKPNKNNWILNSTTGLTISFWMNTAGPSAGNIMRLFDLPYSTGLKGLSVDLSGTNMIYSNFNSTNNTYYTNSTYTISGNYVFIPFTESGALTLSQATTIYYLMVGGGGGGAYYLGGGGGGGGVTIGSIYVPSSDTLTINVGQGGTAATTNSVTLPFTNNGGDGGNSSILFQTNKNLSVQVNGGKGAVVKTVAGSDGGKSGNGFLGAIANGNKGGGGGGAGADGNGITGGEGYLVANTIYNYILPNPTFFGGGGGGTVDGTGGSGGLGGGGHGYATCTSGTPNTGGGGGGDSQAINNSGYGGSGIVYIAIPYTSTPSSLNIAPVGTSSNLLAYYPFDTSLNGYTPNKYTGTSVYDFSLNIAATISATPGTYPTFFTGKNALQILNNSSLHVVYVNNSSNKFTISFWCYITDWNGIYSNLISWNNSGNANDSIPNNGSEYFMYHATNERLDISQHSDSQETVGYNRFNPNIIPLNTWVFYSYSYDGSYNFNILVKPYGGGADIFNRSFGTKDILQVPKYFYFGQQSGYNPLTGASLSGYFKNFQFYSTNLTSNQLRNLYYTNNITSSSTLGLTTANTLGPIDYLSYETQQAFINPSGVSNAVGGAVAYATILLYSGYNGPVMNIRNGTTNTSSDFYADINGNLGTDYLASGLSLESWLTGAIPYVNVWYDQTGNKNHANQTNMAYQPVYNQISKYIDFGSGLTYGQSFGAGAYFNLPNGAVPYGNSNFTYTYKHGPKGTVVNNTVFNFGSNNGANGGYIKSFLIPNITGTTNCYFFDCLNDYLYTSPNSIIDNGVVTTKYTAGTGFNYYINSKEDTYNQISPTTTRTQDNTTNRIGTNNDNSLPLNRGLYYFYGVPKVVPDADLIIIESTINYAPTDYAIYYPLTYVDASRNKIFNGVSRLYDATLNNSPIISTSNYKIAPGALSLNGSNQYVSGLPTFTNTSTSFSFSVWFYFNELNNNYQTLFGCSVNSGYSIAVFVDSNSSLNNDNYKNGYLAFTLFGGAGYGGEDRPIYPVVINQWTHLTWVVKGTSWYIYINGSLYATKTGMSTPPIISRSDFYIGGNGYPGYYMNGLVQDFRVYNRALNQDEITSIYNYPSSPSSAITTESTIGKGLIAHFPFDNTIGSTTITEKISSTSITSNNGAVIASNAKVGNGCLDCTSNKNMNTNGLSMTISTAFTICFWIKFNILPSTSNVCSYMLISVASTANGNQIYINNLGTSSVYIGVYGGYKIFNNTGIFTPTSTTTWTHLAFMLNGSTFYQYVNGVQVSTGTANNIGNIPGTYQYISFGDYTTGGTQYSNCYLDDFRIYNRALTQDEITTVYNYNSSISSTITNTVSTTISGPIDALSSSARNAMIGTGGKSAGAYATSLVYSGYTGAILKIRNGTTNSTQDFYADTSGNLGTTYLASGTSLETWLAGAVPYVTTWYDQTGNSNHATQTTTTSQPIYNQTAKYVDFGTATTGGQANAFFSLPDNTIPYNNSPFTVTLKHGALTFGTGNSGGFLGCGTFADGRHNGFWIGDSGGSPIYRNVFYNNDYDATTLVTANNVVTYRLVPGTSRTLYVNNILDNPSRNQGTNNNAFGTNNYLGWIGNGSSLYTNGPLHYVYIAPVAMGDADRNILENTFDTNLTNAPIYLPLTSNTLNIGTDKSNSPTSTLGAVPISTFNSILAASFTGNSSDSGTNYLRVTVSPSNYNNMTIGFWMYVNDSGYYNPISINGSSGQNYLNADIASGNAIVLISNGLATGYNIYSSYTYQQKWTHIVYRLSRVYPYLCQMYVNGTVVISVNGSPQFDPAIINIGASSDNQRGYNGGIRDFFVFNSLLTSAAIKTIYTSSPLSSNLSTYLKLYTTNNITSATLLTSNDVLDLGVNAQIVSINHNGTAIAYQSNTVTTRNLGTIHPLFLDNFWNNNGYLSLPFINQKKFTICFWRSLGEPQYDLNTAIRVNDGTSDILYFNNSTNNSRFNLYVNGLTITNSYNLSTVGIVHIAFTVDQQNSVINLYRNGSLVGSASSATGTSIAFSGTTFTAYIGQGYGLFYFFRIYNTVLNATEISNLYYSEV